MGIPHIDDLNHSAQFSITANVFRQLFQPDKMMAQSIV